MASDWPLHADPATGCPDVEFAASANERADSPVPPGPDAAYSIERTDGRISFRISGVGEFLISAAEIRYQFARTVPAEQVEHYLLGIVMALWLEAAGRLVFHGAALEFSGNAVGFLGVSGAGKSTLALNLAASGHRLIGDDQVVLVRGPHGFLVAPTVPWIKAWPDALLGASVDFERLPTVHPLTEKRRITVAVDKRASSTTPLRRLYLLKRTPALSQISFVPVAGRDAIVGLLRSAYGPRMLAAAGLSARRLPALAGLAAMMGVWELRYPDDLSQLSGVGPAVVQHLAST